MKSTVRFFVAIACILCLGAIATVAGAEDVSMTIQQSSCCFENPRYTGTCVVTPGEDESCSSILGYLNNPNSVGKMYCGNTKVRGGWTQVSCEEAARTTTANACRDTDTRE